MTGLKRCIDVIAPEGTVVNATYPAPVSISTVGFRWLVTVAATQAVARMFDSSDNHRDRACPSWNSSSNCNNIFAVLPDGGVRAPFSPIIEAPAQPAARLPTVFITPAR